MICILVIVFLLSVITSLKHGKAPQDITILFEISVKGLKLEFKKKEKDAPSCKK